MRQTCRAGSPRGRHRPRDRLEVAGRTRSLEAGATGVQRRATWPRASSSFVAAGTITLSACGSSVISAGVVVPISPSALTGRGLRVRIVTWRPLLR